MTRTQENLLIVKLANFLALKGQDGLHQILFFGKEEDTNFLFLDERRLYKEIYWSLNSSHELKINLANAYEWLIRFGNFEKIKKYAEVYFQKNLFITPNIT